MNLELISRIFYLEKEIERLETLETAISVGGGAITFIETQALVAPAAAITFSSIPSIYTHLFFTGSLRSAIVGEDDVCRFHVNNVGLLNAVFDSFVTRWAGSPKASFNTNMAQQCAVGFCNGANSPANLFTAFSLWLYFYADISRNRTMKSQYAFGKDITAPDIEATEGTVTSHWMNTAAAINRIDFETWAGANNFVAGTTVSMFGVLGS